jgi:hypothetical protein
VRDRARAQYCRVRQKVPRLSYYGYYYGYWFNTVLLVAVACCVSYLATTYCCYSLRYALPSDPKVRTNSPGEEPGTNCPQPAVPQVISRTAYPVRKDSYHNKQNHAAQAWPSRILGVFGIPD